MIIKKKVELYCEIIFKLRNKNQEKKDGVYHLIYGNPIFSII